MTASIVNELQGIPMSPTLAATVQRASTYAAAQSHVEVTLEHMLLALTEDLDANSIFAATNIDITRLKGDVSIHLGRLEHRHQPGQSAQPQVSADLNRILSAAAEAAKGRRDEINGAIVLAAIVGDAKSPAAHLLEAQGLTFEEAIRVLQTTPAPAGTISPTDLPSPNQETTQQPPRTSTDDILAKARDRVATRSPTTGRPASTSSPPVNEPSTPNASNSDSDNKEHQSSPVLANEETIAVSDGPKPNPFAHSNSHSPTTGPPSPQPPNQQPPPPPVPTNTQTKPPANQQTFGTTAGRPSFGSPSAIPTDPLTHPQPAGPVHHQQPAAAPAPTRHPPPPPPPRTGPTIAPTPLQKAPSFGTPSNQSVQQNRPFNGPANPSPVTAGRTLANTRNDRLEQQPHTNPPRQSHTRPTPQPHLPGQRPEPTLSPPGPTVGNQSPQTTQSPTQSRARKPNIEAGQMVENIPRVMRVAIPALVEIRIAKAHIPAVGSRIQGASTTYRHELLVTNAMAVRLRAPDGGFFIETASPETQWIENKLGVDSEDYASWRWTVTPKERGKKRLQVIVSARTVGIDGLAAETALPDRVFDIRVRTNYGRSFKRIFGWTAAAVIGGLLARFGEQIWDYGTKLVQMISAN